MTKSTKKTHFLQASANAQKLRQNLMNLLDAHGNRCLEVEHLRNVSALYALGFHFYDFATKLDSSEWRNIISRCYYGAYNIRRSIQLWTQGHYSTDVSDHQKIDIFPADFPRADYYARRLKDLREDRNLCDYDHDATIEDLLLGTPGEIIEFMEDFASQSRAYLVTKGVPFPSPIDNTKPEDSP